MIYLNKILKINKTINSLNKINNKAIERKINH